SRGAVFSKSAPLAARGKLYKTGDLARWLPDETIEFLGRIDDQVKLRGYRIELGEIENCLIKHKQVKEALVVVKDGPVRDIGKDKYLCAYIVPRRENLSSTSQRPGEIGIPDSKKIFTLKDIMGGNDTTGIKEENIYQYAVNQFEQHVKKNHDRIAVKSNGKALTYDSLNQYANQVARKIIEEYDDRYKLSKRERIRYKRQMLLHGWGIGTQERLKSTTVFVAGAGGGASPTLMQLALTGIGTLIVCDYDVVELSNLNRQFLHDETRIGMNKALSAKMTLERINPDVTVIPISEKLTNKNIAEFVGNAEIIFDMLDDPADKFVLSEYAVAAGIPHIIIAMTDINAYTAVFHTSKTPCYHCVFDKKKLETIVSGMQHYIENYHKNPLPVVATSLFISTGAAVNEALKILLGFKSPAYNKFFYFNQRGEEENLIYTPGYKAMTHLFSDHFLRLCQEQGFDWDVGWRGNFLEELTIEPDPDCEVCGPKAKEKCNPLGEQKKKKKMIPIDINEEPKKKKKQIQIVAFLLPHDIDMAVGIIGVLKAGKTCAPFKPTTSIDRLCEMLEDSEARIILCDNENLALAKRCRDKVNKNIRVINIKSIDIEKLGDSNGEARLENFEAKSQIKQPAYISYPLDSSHSMYTENTDFNALVKDLYEALLKGKNNPYIFTFVEEKQNREINPSQFSMELRKYLMEELPDYMVPSNFVQLDRIPLTPNGKADIKALPDPEMKTGSMEAFSSPRNEVEKKLIRIWSEVLKIDKDTISIDTNFFEIGGHSLNATILVSKIHKELNARMPLAEIFKRPRIRTLSEYINSLTLDKYISIDPLEKREYYEPSSAQKRLYVLQQMDLRSTSYNMPMIIPLDSTADKEKLEETFMKLIHRHESFRTSLKMINSQPVQRIHHHVDFSIDYFEVASMEESAGQDSKPQEIVNNFVKSFDLNQAPLLRVMLLKVDGGRYLLMVDTHHITSDGTSHQILRKDFMRLYAGDELEPLRLQYRDFSNWQNALYKTAKFKQQEEYWLNLYAGEIPKLNLPTDYPRPITFNFDGDIFKFVLGMEEAMQFKKLGGKYNSTLFMNMLAAFNVLLHKYTGQDDIIVGTGIAGRPHTDLQGIIGMFVNMLALRNYPGGNKTYDGFLKEVTGNCLKAFENQDVQFEALVDKVELDRDPSRNPIFDVTMVVQNFERDRSQGEETAAVTSPSNQRENDVDFSRYDQQHRTSKFDMTLFFSEIGDEIYFTLEYYTRIFSRKTIERLVKHSLNIIRQVIIKPDIKLSDIDVLSKEEKQELLFNFNKTASDYPHEKTIHELFEERVRKIPDNLATVHENEALSYRQLEKRANQLANYLYFGKKLQPENLVGILMERSIDQIIAILGVLKAGGAYLPIDFSLPEERIKNMIDDAGVGIVISQKKFIRILNQLQWECKSFNTFLCMDSVDIYSEEETEKNQLMDETLWNYVADSATNEITGGGWFSSYTGEPFSKEEMEEYGDNILKKLSPLLNKKMKVLEIGCGSGISMYRIAPHVNCYYGTDLSRGIIEMNKKRMKEEGHTNIFLSCLPAHNLDKLETRDFDLVIINSVIQSFHGYNYLRRIIAKAIDLMTDKGYFFIGDIMDRDLKENLIREMIEFKYSEEGNSKTKTDWSADLFVPREFFEDLSIERTEIINVEYSDKIYSIENELTKFRYDTLLTIDKTLKGPGKVGSKYKYQHDNRTLAKYPLDAVGTAVKPGNLAYVIYTSGSTGKSKGVMVEHKNVIRLVKNTNYINHLDFKEGDRFLLTGAFAFDITTFEIWGLLLNGYSLYMVDKNVILDIEKLREAIVKNKISVVHFIPQLLIQVAEHCPEIFEKLEYLLVGGDVVRPEPLNWLRKR
ncbi:MAG: AMP-binding protein, partial [Candidatus Aminicenantes bacterium]